MVGMDLDVPMCCVSAQPHPIIAIAASSREPEWKRASRPCRLIRWTTIQENPKEDYLESWGWPEEPTVSQYDILETWRWRLPPTNTGLWPSYAIASVIFCMKEIPWRRRQAWSLSSISCYLRFEDCRQAKRRQTAPSRRDLLGT